MTWFFVLLSLFPCFVIPVVLIFTFVLQPIFHSMLFLSFFKKRNEGFTILFHDSWSLVVSVSRSLVLFNWSKLCTIYYSWQDLIRFGMRPLNLTWRNLDWLFFSSLSRIKIQLHGTRNLDNTFFRSLVWNEVWMSNTWLSVVMILHLTSLFAKQDTDISGYRLMMRIPTQPSLFMLLETKRNRRSIMWLLCD